MTPILRSLCHSAFLEVLVLFDHVKETNDPVDQEVLDELQEEIETLLDLLETKPTEIIHGNN
jgi:hypothetical protein